MVNLIMKLKRHAKENANDCWCDECKEIGLMLADALLTAIAGLNCYKGMTKGIGLNQPAVHALANIELSASRVRLGR